MEEIKQQLSELLCEKVNFWDDDLGDAVDAILDRYRLIPRKDIVAGGWTAEYGGARSVFYREEA